MTTEGWILIAIVLGLALLGAWTNRRLGELADEISDLRQDLTGEP